MLKIKPHNDKESEIWMKKPPEYDSINNTVDAGMSPNKIKRHRR